MQIIRNDNDLNIETVAGKLILCTPGQSSRPDGPTRLDRGAVLTKQIIEIIEDQLSSEVSVRWLFAGPVGPGGHVGKTSAGTADLYDYEILFLTPASGFYNRA